MRSILRALLCSLMLGGHVAVARADADYYEAFRLADAAAKARKLDEAVSAIVVALRKYPSDYALTLRLGFIEYQLKRFPEAERLYRAAIRLSDGSVDARAGLGQVLFEQDRCAEAVDLFEQVLAETPDNIAAARALQICRRRAKRQHNTQP